MQSLRNNSRYGRIRSALGGGVLAVLAAAAHAAPSPQVPLAPLLIPQFVQPLPLLSLPAGPGSPTAAGTIPAIVAGTSTLNFAMCEFDASVLPPGTPLAAGAPGTTRVWGYTWGSSCNPRDVYLGPVVVAERDVPTAINFVNALGNASTTGVLAYRYSTDMTLHWADPLGTNPAGGNTGTPELNACAAAGGVPAFGSACAQNYAGAIPAVPHLHGGEVPPVLDGGPDAWWTRTGIRGHAFYSKAGNAGNAAIYRYPNGQEAAPIWFHDHTLGATRLNVYAGLAGGYLITDPGALDPTLPPPAQIVPLIIQDRMFDTNGQLFFPADSAGGVLSSVNPEHPYWVPEFVGDTIAVNGRVWPNLNVEARRYRVLFLNGSNARTYVMTLSNNQPIYVIANDGGYLDAPVRVTTLTMMPGERYEAIIDFRGAAGKTLQLKNAGKTPFPNGAQPAASTVGRLMQFSVAACGGKKQPLCPVDNSFDPAAAGATVRTAPMVRLVNAATGTLAAGVSVANTRQLTLNEVMGLKSAVTDPVTGLPTNYPGGPLEILVNNTKWDGMRPDGTVPAGFQAVTVGGTTAFYSEVMNEGDTEVWEIVNTTADAHPMHTHLTDFQILNRQAYDTKRYTAAYNQAFPGGLYLPAYGPPLDYATGNPRALGGNPDVTPFLVGAPRPPAPEESGWKDTVITFPGQVTRIAVRFLPNSVPVGQTAWYPFDPNAAGHGYVWHCHIVDHEDNEMMRPDLVNPLPGVTRSYRLGVEY